MADAAQLAFAEASAASFGASGPVSEQPGGTELRGTGPGGQGPQLLRAVSGRMTTGIQTHHLSLLHASSAGLGAWSPLSQGPLGSAHPSDGVDGLPTTSVVGHRRAVVGSFCKVAVFHPRPRGFPDREDLDGEGLGEWGKAPDALQGGGAAAVAQQCPSQGNVCLHGHQLVIAI